MLLPEPFLPIKATFLPFFILKLACDNKVLSLTVRFRFFTSIGFLEVSSKILITFIFISFSFFGFYFTSKWSILLLIALILLSKFFLDF